MASNEQNVTPNQQGDGEENLDVAEMSRGHLGMKLLVVGLGIAIIAMVYLVAMRASVAFGDKPKPVKVAVEQQQVPAGQKMVQVVEPSTHLVKEQISLALPKGGVLKSTSVSGDIMTLTYVLESGGYAVHVVQLSTGRVISKIDIQ